MGEKRFFIDGVEVTKERAEEFTNETLMCVNSKGLDWVIEEMRRLQNERKRKPINKNKRLWKRKK